MDIPTDLTLSILARGWRHAHGPEWIVYVAALSRYFRALNFLPCYGEFEGRPRDAPSILGRLLKGLKGFPFESMHQLMLRLSKGVFFQSDERYINHGIAYLLDMMIYHDPEKLKKTTEYKSLYRATHLSPSLWELQFKQVRERNIVGAVPPEEDMTLGTIRGYGNVLSTSGSERDQKHLVLAWINGGLLETQEWLVTTATRNGVDRPGWIATIGTRLLSSSRSLSRFLEFGANLDLCQVRWERPSSSLIRPSMTTEPPLSKRFTLTFLVPASFALSSISTFPPERTRLHPPEKASRSLSAAASVSMLLITCTRHGSACSFSKTNDSREPNVGREGVLRTVYRSVARARRSSTVRRNARRSTPNTFLAPQSSIHLLIQPFLFNHSDWSEHKLVCGLRVWMDDRELGTAEDLSRMEREGWPFTEYRCGTVRFVVPGKRKR